MRIGYGKIGRSMPLTLDKCGTLGGDVEMASVIRTLAERNPQHTFVLIGRNDGSRPEDIGMPPNIENPWVEWSQELLVRKRDLGIASVNNMTVEQHLRVKSIYDHLTLPTITALDGIVLWAGQHGTTNSPIPSIKDRSVLTKPHDWSEHYCAFLLHGINCWRDVDPLNREEVWLNSDPRNYLKMRDTKWPLRHPVLCQRNYSHNIKHERYGDSSGFDAWYCPGRAPTAGGIGPWNVDVATADGHTNEVWKSSVNVVYSRLEINGLTPGSPFGNLISYNDEWEDRLRFGLFSNEARKYVHASKSRIHDMRTWVLPMEPDWVHGTWSDASQTALNMKIVPAPWSEYYPKLHSVRCTFTPGNYGNGWATTKPWEAFAAGTVCFFHPDYDTQNNILADAPAELLQWLRVKTPEELRSRIDYLNSSAGMLTWKWLVQAQHKHFVNAIEELTYAKMIETRLFGAHA